MAITPEARHLANAVYAVAGKVGQVNECVEHLEQIAQFYRVNKPFRHFLLTERIPLDQKVEILKALLSDVLSELEFQILEMILRKKMALLLVSLVRRISYLAQKDKVRLEMVIESACPLPEMLVRNMTDKIMKEFVHPVHADVIVNPRLLGGIKLRLGNTLIDGSLARRIEQLRASLIQT